MPKSSKAYKASVAASRATESLHAVAIATPAAPSFTLDTVGNDTKSQRKRRRRQDRDEEVARAGGRAVEGKARRLAKSMSPSDLQAMAESGRRKLGAKVRKTQRALPIPPPPRAECPLPSSPTPPQFLTPRCTSHLQPPTLLPLASCL